MKQRNAATTVYLIIGDGTREVAPLFFQRRQKSFAFGFRLKRNLGWHFTYHEDGKLWARREDKNVSPPFIDMNQGPLLNDFKGIHTIINGMTLDVDSHSLSAYRPAKHSAERIYLDKRQFAAEKLSIFAQLVEFGRCDVVQNPGSLFDKNAILHIVTSINPWLVISIAEGHQ